MSRKLAFTCGDPAGIGPEIIAVWLAAHMGTGRASGASFGQAVALARRWVRRRPPG